MNARGGINFAVQIAAEGEEELEVSSTCCVAADDELLLDGIAGL